MIVDTYRPDPEGPDHIYKRWRDAEGNLIEETVSDFRPYFWVPASTSRRYMERVLGDFYGSSVDWNDTAEALRTGETLVKVYAYRQRDIKDIARRFTKTWEADLSLEDRYLIDNVSQGFGTSTLNGARSPSRRQSWLSLTTTTTGMFLSVGKSITRTVSMIWTTMKKRKR